VNKSFKDNIIGFFDKENTGENPFPYVVIAVVTMLIAKIMNAKFIICILSAIIMTFVLGVVAQLLKK
jgi:hypothetical protein